MIRLQRAVAWLLLCGLMSVQGAVWLAARHAGLDDDVACAQAEGMTTLLQDGVLKVLQGVTDIIQVKAVASK